MANIREILRKPWATISVISSLVLLVGVVSWQVYRAMAPTATELTTQDRLFVCAETGKSYHYRVKLGDRAPYPSPHSGKDTGYPAELCYWTADGKPKTDPTPVLLNQYVGKPGPTFCPDCGRIVVGHNPAPTPGANPPLTKDQYTARHNQDVPNQDRRD